MWEKKALAIFDHFKDQMTETVTKELEENTIHSVLTPANCTGYLQPLDISVNKVVKSFLRAQFSEWYADELTEKFIDSDDEPVDISTARMKCVGGQWFLILYEHREANPQITVNGFKHAGIHQVLGVIDEEIPSYFDEESSDVDESDEDEFPSSDDDVSSSTPLLAADVHTTVSNSNSEGEFSPAEPSQPEVIVL